MNPKILRRSVLASLVIVSGCAAFDREDSQLIVSAGSTICLGTTASCAALNVPIRELHTPEMTAAICAAGADTKDCKK